MSIFFKPMGYLAAFAASVGGAGCSPGAADQQAGTAASQGEQSIRLPQAPLKIPMPLDKAGHKVDVTFELPPLPEGRTAWHHFIGLRVVFPAGTDEVLDALEAHPVKARIALYRIMDDGQAVQLRLLNKKIVSNLEEHPDRFEVFEIPGGVATARSVATQFSGAPPGTPGDTSTKVLSFTGSDGDKMPGIYRLQVETLEDIPALNGATSFLVYEERRRG